MTSIWTHSKLSYIQKILLTVVIVVLLLLTKTSFYAQMTSEEHLVPPFDQLCFGPYTLDAEYKAAIYQRFPFYTFEEIVGSYLGYNPHFKSYNEWMKERKEEKEERMVMRAFQNTSAYVVPPFDQLVFGPYTLDAEYKEALYEEFPLYTGKEIVSSYLGYNEEFVSYEEWLLFKTKNEDMYSL